MPLQIEKNPYIRECASSTFSVLFNNARPDNDIEFVHALLQYTDFSPDVDLFQYIRSLRRIQKNRKLFFVFDASTEGFSPFDYYFFDILYNNCKKYNIDPKKIIFVSANLRDEQNIKKYNKRNNIKQSIIVFSFLSFKKMVRDLLENHKTNNLTASTYIDKWYLQNRKNYNGHYFLSLSRVNRLYRTYGIYCISKSNLTQKALISHNTMNEKELSAFSNKFGISLSSIDKWKRSLPLIADTKDFHTNHAVYLGSHLHNSTLFQIVNETTVDDRHKTSMFYSEKTFKPIAHMQPFLVWGQRHCNYILEQQGFQLYHELFDYSFDNIKNPIERFDALLKTVKNAVSKLDKMSKSQQLEWRWKCRQKLMHNFNVLADEEHDLDKFKKLHEKIERLIYGSNS